MARSHPPRGRWVIALALALAACGPPPSPAPASPAGPAVACVDLDESQCRVVLDGLGAHLQSGGTAAHVVISQRFCDGPCPGAETGTWLSHVFVQFVDAREPAFFATTVDGGGMHWEVIPTFTVHLAARSPRLVRSSTTISLKICGLGGPIDVDGSFWDPVGVIAASILDDVDRTSVTFTLTSIGRAELSFGGTTLMRLVRHAGPIDVTPCD